MRKILAFLIFSVFAVYLLTSCRPPELEGAYVDYNAKRIDSAIELAKEATDKYPDNAEAPYLLGLIYGEKGMFTEMVQSFDKSLERNPEQFKKEINDSKNYYFQTEYKNAYDSYVSYQNNSANKTDTTYKALDNAIKHAENASIIEPNDYSSVKLAALAANYKNDTDTAIKKFQLLTNIRPDTVDGWFQLGRAYFNAKDYESAIKYNKKALELDNKYVPSLELIAFSYESLKDTVNAIDAYKAAIDVDPNNISYLFNLGLIYNKRAAAAPAGSKTLMDNYANAEKYFSQAIHIDPDELDEFQRSLYDANLEILYSLTCVAQIQQRKFAEAKETAQSGIDYFPDSADLYDYLSICEANLGNKKEAKEASDKANQLRGE